MPRDTRDILCKVCDTPQLNAAVSSAFGNHHHHYTIKDVRISGVSFRVRDFFFFFLWESGCEKEETVSAAPNRLMYGLFVPGRFCPLSS